MHNDYSEKFCSLCQKNSVSSWHFHRFAKGKLKLKRECPFGIVRDGARFYKTLRGFRIDCKEWRFREISEVIDNYFLLFRIPEIQTTQVNAIDCSGSGHS